MYKTIVLELLQERPQVHEFLLKNRILLAALERYAWELKTRHDEWKDRLSRTKPDSDQVAPR